MNWQLITEKVQEIFELQQRLIAKIQTEEIKMILDRNHKYKDMDSLKIKKLNNALLEHQISITPYQMIIFSKANVLTNNAFREALYAHMPKKLEVAINYVDELIEKFELALESLDIVIALERLSTVEYSEVDFSKSIYSHKVDVENNIYLECVPHVAKDKENEFRATVSSRIKEFKKSLSAEEKQNLLLEMFTLSYDRNAFDFINNLKIVNMLANKNRYTTEQYMAESTRYDIYITVLRDMDKHALMTMPLETIYEEFKPILEADLYKKVIKK